MSNDYQSDSKEYISQLIPENVSYGLKVSSKGEKLSHDQRIFLKDLSNNYNIPTIEIWKAFNVSPAVLNRMKRTTEEELNQMGVKKFRKFYETQKQRLIKWIHEYIKTNKSTFTTKEVARFVNLKWLYWILWSYNKKIYEKSNEMEL